MNGDRIDFELSRRGYHPRVIVAAFRGTPETFGRSGEHQTRNRRVLQDRSSTTRLRRDALDLVPVFSTVWRFVNSAARRSYDVIRIPWIKIDGKNIRVIDDAILDNPPRLPTIKRLVRQVPGARVDNI